MNIRITFSQWRKTAIFWKKEANSIFLGQAWKTEKIFANLENQQKKENFEKTWQNELMVQNWCFQSTYFSKVSWVWYLSQRNALDLLKN